LIDGLRVIDRQRQADRHSQLLWHLTPANIPEATEHVGLGEARYWQLCSVSPIPQLRLSTHLSPVAVMGML